jgi:CRP-like cAMP-binding protein
VDDLAQGQGGLPRELMLRWQLALDAAEAWLSELSTGSARQRLLRLLLRLSDHADAQGVVWLPRREEIGAMLDVTMETASRQVSALKREGVLTLVGGRSARVHLQVLQQCLQAEDRA